MERTFRIGRFAPIGDITHLSPYPVHGVPSDAHARFMEDDL